MKKKSKKAVKKEDKTKYDKFKVKKTKSKAKAKSKPKVKPKAKVVVGNFDADSDWRLKEVHHDINKVRKSVYDLSLNDEGEHDDIVKKIQRCSDSIANLHDWVMSRDVSKRLDDLIIVGADFRDRMEVIEGYMNKMSLTQEKILSMLTKMEERVDCKFDIKHWENNERKD